MRFSRKAISGAPILASATHASLLLTRGSALSRPPHLFFFFRLPQPAVRPAYLPHTLYNLSRYMKLWLPACMHAMSLCTDFDSARSALERSFLAYRVRPSLFASALSIMQHKRSPSRCLCAQQPGSFALEVKMLECRRVYFANAPECVRARSLAL